MTKEEFLSFVETSAPPLLYKALVDNLKVVSEDIDNDSNFVMRFQKLIASKNGKTNLHYALSNVDVFSKKDESFQPKFASDATRNISNWAVRHYSSQKHDIIKSQMSLAQNGITIAGHTGHSDWTRLGNVGNTFFVLCYEGKPLFKNAGFLSDTKYYFELPLKDVDNLWISTDLLPLDNDTNPTIIAGTSKNVFSQLLKIGGSATGQTFVNMLLTTFGDKVEVKIPHSINSPLTQWKDNKQN